MLDATFTGIICIYGENKKKMKVIINSMFMYTLPNIIEQFKLYFE